MNILLYFMAGAVLGGVFAALYGETKTDEAAVLKGFLILALVAAWPVMLPAIIAFKIAKRFAK